MKGKGIKGAIAASALSAVLCAGMLAGTTFAWFTDTVSSNGNRIMAATSTSRLRSRSKRQTARK